MEKNEMPIKKQYIVEIGNDAFLLDKENRCFDNGKGMIIPFDAITLRQADLITKQLGSFEWYTSAK